MVGPSSSDKWQFRVWEDRLIKGFRDFLLRGNVVDLAVVPMNRLNERRARTEAAEPTDVELLGEIRDLLREQRR